MSISSVIAFVVFWPLIIIFWATLGAIVIPIFDPDAKLLAWYDSTENYALHAMFWFLWPYLLWCFVKNKEPFGES